MRRLFHLVIALLFLPSTKAWMTSPYHRMRIAPLFAVHEAPKKYDLGLGKNLPKGQDASQDPVDATSASVNWIAPTPVEKPPGALPIFDSTMPIIQRTRTPIRTKKLVARTEETKRLRGAVWDEEHYQLSSEERDPQHHAPDSYSHVYESSSSSIPVPTLLYPDIDLSIPSTIYSETTDAVWELLRYEAYMEAQREPLLVSFLYSTILNHNSLESALAFHLANRLSSPAMISTQIQSLILEALKHSPEFRQSLRADVMAVRDRDPACTCLPDAFLYFKGFHALQTHRVAHYMYRHERQVLAHYLQSQVSQNFQIDIHPNATMGAGIMLDHGTGIVIGETATVGHNCSILHHVTLGGSGKKGVDRHPKVGNGVLLGAGASVLGNVIIGDGCQVGAGTLVISDLPAHSVAVGVPAKIIGSFVDVTEQPSIGMNQLTGTRDFDEHIITFASGGI
jgi:serine O-acetyltransferase